MRHPGSRIWLLTRLELPPSTPELLVGGSCNSGPPCIPSSTVIVIGNEGKGAMYLPHCPLSNSSYPELPDHSVQQPWGPHTGLPGASF